MLALWFSAWFSLAAQPEETPAIPYDSATNSLLWRIQPPQADLPASFLYGTIHIIPRDSFFLPSGLETAMETAEHLVMELPLDMDMGSLMQSARSMLMPPGQRLQDLLSAEDYAYLQAYMRDSVATPIPFYQMLKPIFTLQQLSTGVCDPGGAWESYELFFSKRFGEMGKPVSGLETIAEQLAVLDSIPLADQAQSLMETVRAPRAGCEALQALIRHYRSQDLSALMRLTESDESFGSQREVLLDSRNRRWIARIEAILAEGKPVLIAVGAGHLAGPEGVIHLLRQAGYTVVPYPAG